MTPKQYQLNEYQLLSVCNQTKDNPFRGRIIGALRISTRPYVPCMRQCKSLMIPMSAPKREKWCRSGGGKSMFKGKLGIWTLFVLTILCCHRCPSLFCSLCVCVCVSPLPDSPSSCFQIIASTLCQRVAHVLWRCVCSGAWLYWWPYMGSMLNLRSVRGCVMGCAWTTLTIFLFNATKTDRRLFTEQAVGQSLLCSADMIGPVWSGV